MRHWRDLVPSPIATPCVLWALFALVGDLSRCSAQKSFEAPYHQPWRWTSFTVDSGLPSNDVRRLSELDGVPFVQTPAGLARYDGWRWEPVVSEPIDVALETGVPCAGTREVLWVASESEFMACEDGQLRRIPLPRSQEGKEVHAIAPAGDRTFLLFRDRVSRALTAYSLHDGTWERVDGLGEFSVGSRPPLWRSERGTVWACTERGYFAWRDGAWRERFRIGGEENSPPAAFSENGAGRGLVAVLGPTEARGIWEFGSEGGARHVVEEGAGRAQQVAVGPGDAALVLYDANELRLRTPEGWRSIDPLPAPFTTVHFLRFRPNGDLWVGTRSGLHLARLSLRHWSTFRHEGFDDPRNRVAELFLDADERLWIGHADGLEVRDLEGTLLDVTFPERTIVTGLGQDEDAVVWASSGSGFGGLLGWDGDTWRRLETNGAGEPLGLVHKLRRAQGSLWALSLTTSSDRPRSTAGAVHRIVDGRAERWEPADEILPRRVYDLAETPDGALWFATSRGVCRFDGRGWRTWLPEDGLRDPSVFRLQPRREGDGVWFAHPIDGLGAVVEDRVEYFAARPPGAVRIWDLALDGEDLWITTDCGVVRRLPDGSTSVFDHSNGLENPQAWSVLPTDRRVLIGTLGSGVYRLDRPDDSVAPPRVTLDPPALAGGEVVLAWNVASYWASRPAHTIETRYRFDGGPWSAYDRTRSTRIAGQRDGVTFEVQARGASGRDGPVAATTLDLGTPFLGRTGFLVPVGVLTLALACVALLHLERRRRDAEALRRSEADYRTLMEQASDAILVCDRTGRITYVNAVGRELFGDDLTYRPLEDLTDGDESERRQIQLAIAAPSRNVLQLTVRGSDGEPRAVEANLKHLDDDRILAIVRDVSRRQQLEDERRELEHQVMEAQKLESLGRLAGGLAHDFNNLLMLVLGHADQARYLLRKNPDRIDEAVENMTEVVAAAERAGDLTQNLLSFSGKETMEPRPIDLSEVIAGVENLLQSSVARGLTVELQLASGLPRVEADPARMRQVVMNLVQNASDAMSGSEGAVVVRTRMIDTTGLPPFRVQLDGLERSGQYVVLEVADQGSGMSEETRRRIFDPFFTTRFAGRGMGLAAVRGIVHNHNGAIHVESEPGSGSTFSVYLPVSEALVPQPPPAEPRKQGRGEYVLVIDDDLGVQTIVTGMIERAGYRPLAASSGAEGIELFRQHDGEVACTIVDLTMPKMDGLETRRSLLTIDKHAPVLLMSGFNEDVATARQSTDSSAIFLQKPFTADELLRMVAKHARRPSGAPQPD